ncbi:MAG: S1C family serine protease [Chloroflexota bacterium]
MNRLPSVLRPLLAATVAISLVVGCNGAKSGAPASGAAASASAASASGAAVQPVATGAAGGGTTVAAAQTGTSGDWAQIPSIVAEVEPSVVSVLRADAEGSGVVWSADGIIVTNNHVVEGVRKVKIAFADGTRVDGDVVATDPLSDLAVVRAARTNLPAATFADQVPPVGSLAIAIGNPLGFENSVTAGIISGTGRAIPGAAQDAPALIDLVQTDAAISPGNSGGALVGGDGRIIGINVAYIPPEASAVSIGFAIPAPTVKDVVEQLLATGKVLHAYLGVQPAELTPQIAQQFSLSRDTGALVVDVVADGPAGAAGIQAGDVITAIGGVQVNTVEDLLGALRKHRPGEKVDVRVVRGSDEQTISATLGDFPG